MQHNTETKIWNATLYLRLSRDDGDKEESNSITGQRELLRDFIRTRPELREYAVRIDDGFTGSNFERPSFKKMLEDVKAGRTNCIIVKDLSRFGRNYLDAGEYIEKIFPFLGVRFIAVNDNYDSLGGKNASDELIIPFKNLINEAYCRDISVKVRTQLEVKRKSGQYIGAFAVYGYLKDETDKNRLVADEYAADVVRDIFKWKLEGMSPQDIAARLNHSGVLSPMEYKKSLGMRFATSFKANPQAAWSANAVLRILKNPVYTGILIQGKETTPSYKVQRQLDKKRSEHERLQKLLMSLYESLADGIIDRDEYARLKQNYAGRCAECEKQMDALQETLTQIKEYGGGQREWMAQFRKHLNITELERSIVVALIDRILIYRDNRVEVRFRFADEFAWQMDILRRAQIREVV